MKKTIILVFGMLFCFVGCGSKDDIEGYWVNVDNPILFFQFESNRHLTFQNKEFLSLRDGKFIHYYESSWDGKEQSRKGSYKEKFDRHYRLSFGNLVLWAEMKDDKNLEVYGEVDRLYFVRIDSKQGRDSLVSSYKKLPKEEQQRQKKEAKELLKSELRAFAREQTARQKKLFDEIEKKL